VDLTHQEMIMALVLGRHPGEAFIVYVGDVPVARIAYASRFHGGDKIRLSIEAPREVVVLREEVAREKGLATMPSGVATRGDRGRDDADA
jgi:sRNA-binding carbon storage regulator CsrA